MPVYLQQLSVTNFRNYDKLRLEFSPQWNLLSGRNGGGKTTLLDAIHYLCLGKSYFHYSDSASVRHEASFFRVEGEFVSDYPIHMSCLYASGGKKELQKNGTSYLRIADHVGVIPVVMVTPDDQLLIDEGSENRRRFIDGTISQIDHAYLETLIEYNRILQQRNSALRQFAERKRIDRALIESYDAELASRGMTIYGARKGYFEEMYPLVRRYYEQLSSGTEEVSAGYESVCNNMSLPEALKRSFEKDCITQRSNEGIHRDDFDFFLNGRSLKKFGSQGQKKTFLMALKFSQYELIRNRKNLEPILLLDDLFDKLDESRSENIFNLIASNDFGQTFVTDTHPARLTGYISNHQVPFVHYSLPEITKQGS